MRVYLVRAGWVAVACVILVAILRSTVADVYRVRSGSMRPTIFGGAEPRSGEVLDERVLVRFGDAAELQRFDLAVVRRGAETPIVKRVAGLPGESFGIAGGDLIVNDARLDLDAPRPAPLPVFDDELQDVRDYFMMRAELDGPWRREDERTWRLEADDVPAGSDAGMMLFGKELRDDYLDQHGKRVVGRREINDARIECEVAPEGAQGRLRFRLVEAGDTFEARIELAEGSAAVATIRRFNSRTLQDPQDANARIAVLARRELELPRDTWTRIVFENVDNHLIFEIGNVRITASYAANEPHAGPTATGATSVGSRIALGGEGCRARFRHIRLLRDLFYVPMGSHGVDRPIVLGPDEYFVLGDNSGESRDSRMFGPVVARDVIGWPTRVVWPLSRARGLSGAAPR